MIMHMKLYIVIMEKNEIKVTNNKAQKVEKIDLSRDEVIFQKKVIH